MTFVKTQTFEGSMICFNTDNILYLKETQGKETLNDHVAALVYLKDLKLPFRLQPHEYKELMEVIEKVHGIETPGL